MSVTNPPGVFMSLGDLGLPTSQAQFLAQWLTVMQSAFPGYQPAAGNLEYIQAQVFASWAADVAQLCSAGSAELFRQFGTQLLALPYEQGTSAVAVATVTATNTNGYTLPVGTQFTLTLNGAQVGFQTTGQLTIPAGSSSGQVTLAALQTGSFFNGAAAPIALVSQIDWVSSVALVTAASGGVDQESDDAYVQRLANTLTTLGFATATASALATRALDFIPTAGTDQEEVGRSTAIDGYNPAVDSFTVTTTSGSANLSVTTAPGVGITAAPGSPISGSGLPSQSFTATTTASSPTLSAVSSFTNLAVGAFVTGTGIPANTQIVSISSSAGTITLNAEATAAGTAVALTASTAIVQSATASSIVISAPATASATGVAAVSAGSLGNERTCWLCVTDSSGNALNTDTMTAVTAYLQGFREANFIIGVSAPTYSSVYVTATVVAQPGYSAATVQANVQAALLAYLSPSNFGLPQGAITGWQNTQTVYLSAVNAVIQNTLGVASVQPGSLAIGVTASPTDTTADLVLSGGFPLVTSSASTVPLSAITVVQ